MRSNLPTRRRHDLELNQPIELNPLFWTLNNSNRKWAIIGACCLPSVNNNIFTDIFTKGLETNSIHYDNVMLLGDLNYILQSDCLHIAK